MKKINIKIWLVYAIFSIIGITSMQSCGEDGLSPSNINLFSTSDEVALRRQLDSQIVTNKIEYPIYNNAAAETYIQGIVNEILQSGEIKYKSTFPYKIRIVKDDSIVNAFAIPGGYIYVYTGLLKFVDNEATLSAVLAHEIAHCERRHATKRMTKAYGLEFLMSIILGKSSSQLEQIAGNLFTNLYLLKNSRDDEYEADDYGFRYLKTSIWYPGGLVYFFNKIGANSDASFLEVLVSTHPMSQDRIDKVNKYVSESGATASESNVFTARYLQFKQTLP